MHKQFCVSVRLHLVEKLLTLRTVGRPFMYGLAISGEQGVEEVIRGILCEAEITLGLCGYTELSQIWGKREKVLERMELGLYSA